MYLTVLSRRVDSGIAALVLAALAGAVYGPYLSNGLVFDDLNLFNGITIYDFATQLWRTQVRWLSYATFAHTQMLSDGSVEVHRLGNLLLHAANAVAVFILLRDLLAAADNRGNRAVADPARAGRLALMGAALFAVHPVAVYGVGYLVQRSGEMATLFMLLMLIAYLRWLTGGRNSLWVASAACYLLSVFSKEHAVAAPAVALLMTVVLRRPTPDLARRLVLPFGVYAVIAVAITLVTKGVLGAVYELDAADMLARSSGLSGEQAVQGAYLLSVITQSWLFFKYLMLWVVPVPGWMSIDMREPLATAFVSWPYAAALPGFFLYAVVAVAMASRGGRVGIAGWALAYPWLMFVTEIATARVQEPFVLYRAYLWFPVFAVAPLLAIDRLRPCAAGLSAAIAVCALVPLSWNRLASLSEPLTAWSDAARHLARGDEPGAERIYYNRGLALAGKGRREEALQDMSRVVAMRPHFAPGRFMRGKTLFELKRYDEALREVNSAVELDPANSGYYLARAAIFTKLGRRAEALADTRKSCDLKNVIACAGLQQRGASRE